MRSYLPHVAALLAATLIAPGLAHAAKLRRGEQELRWATVVNNGDAMPTDSCSQAETEPASPTCRMFNSYNPPSINLDRLVVFRARSRGEGGEGQAVHGIYTRDMTGLAPVVRIFDRTSTVPPPNNLGARFHEPPSFPRIDIGSATLATRGAHQPVWRRANATDEDAEDAGTTGIYTTPFGALITGASKLGSIEDFSFLEVPERPGTFFDVFPGAPAVTDGNTIVFKGNYTAGTEAKTGVYYRELTNTPITLADGTSLSPAGGRQPVILIANSDTYIPGTTVQFGSTAPPSAAGRLAVFTGLDNEGSPTLGGIYLARLLGPQPSLKPLVSIGDKVPGERRGARFNRLGEALSFDGRFVAFWGAWGTEYRTLVLQCPDHGNADRRAYCAEQYPEGFPVQVPLHQGIFVIDTWARRSYALAKSPDDYDDFLYWNFSGHIPGSTEEEDGEPARWRSASFIAVSGSVDGRITDPGFHVAFKARTGSIAAGAYAAPVDGIYLTPGTGLRTVPLIETGMDGARVDAQAIDPDTGADLPVTDMGLERDGFRGGVLAITASMGTEEAGWAGIYLVDIPR